MQQRREIHAINLFHKVIYFRSPPYIYKKHLISNSRS
nr:unnamed protein product [Callosobruchus chinensis]